MAKNCAKKDWLNKENIVFLWLGRVSKSRRILSENERPEIFTEDRRFPAKMGWYLLGISLQEFFSLEISLHLICLFLKLPIHPLKVKWPAPYDHFLHATAIKLAKG